jgi:uncharacterized membrane protein YgaE (UPF0421/DUF939 family)
MSANEVQESVAPAISTVADWSKLQYAVKTSLSLTLAYLIPMGLGWPMPQTAATTVMLIAATGMVSESLQKGVLRVLGTVIGAAIGLTLISLFPQDRLIYLLAVSCTVAIIIYLYNAYQGDSTVFMLTAVVTLMVFNGGDAEGAFLYGVDRAFLTAFGVIVYTVVASMLWPSKSADNTRSLAAGMAGSYRGAFGYLVRPQAREETPIDKFLAELLASGQAFQAQLAAVKNHADGVTDYLPEWNTVGSAYEELEAILLPALKSRSAQAIDYSDYIDNYQPVLDQLEELFHAVDSAWLRQQTARPVQALEIAFNANKLRDSSHLVAATIATRAELLQNIQRALLDLLAALDSMVFDKGPFTSGRKPQGKPAFVWLDVENLKTAVRAFVTFWMATAIWIQFNPPGGFMFVTLCTILIPLVSYTPATPKLLFILFTFGFSFALPAYIFLLPQLTHWLQLAAFLFGYAFLGFYFFQGPVCIFFLLGLFTLGIQNTMSYHVDAIMLSILMFYMICTTLVIAMHFPFSSKSQTLYASLRYRFFRLCARWLRLHKRSNPLIDFLSHAAIGSSAAILTKMSTWGAQIDESLFPGDGRAQVADLNNACELLHGQLQVLELRRCELVNNPLIRAMQKKNSDSPLALLCDNLADQGSAQDFDKLRPVAEDIETRLDQLLGDDYLERYDAHQIAQFYVYLNLQASILDSIEACRDAQQAIDWPRLGETRF